MDLLIFVVNAGTVQKCARHYLVWRNILIIAELRLTKVSVFFLSFKTSLVHRPARNTVSNIVPNPENSNNEVIYIKTERLSSPPDSTLNMGSLTAEIDKMKRQMESLDRRLLKSEEQRNEITEKYINLLEKIHSQ